jgi:RimJ/RimL family protein N-acetyltransferase
MNIPSIETPHLILRSWASDDAETLFNILQDQAVLRYLPNTTPPPIKRAEQYIARQLAHWQERGYGHWAIVSQEDGQVLGWNGLGYLPEIDETEVAFLLRQSVWNHGYATEAARAAIRFGFENGGLETIIGLVHPDNSASMCVLEKSGLTFADKITLWGLELKRYRIHRQVTR